MKPQPSVPFSAYGLQFGCRGGADEMPGTGSRCDRVYDKGEHQPSFLLRFGVWFLFSRTLVAVLTCLSASGKDLHVSFVPPQTERFLIIPSADQQHTDACE